METEFTELDWTLLSTYADELDSQLGPGLMPNWDALLDLYAIHRDTSAGSLTTFCMDVPQYVTNANTGPNSLIFELTELGRQELVRRGLDTWFALAVRDA